MNSDSQLEKRLFAEALQFTTPEQRAEFLRKACGDDARLRQRIEALFEAHEEAGEFLQKPPAGVSAKTLVMTTGMIPVTEKPGDKIGRYTRIEILEKWAASSEIQIDDFSKFYLEVGPECKTRTKPAGRTFQQRDGRRCALATSIENSGEALQQLGQIASGADLKRNRPDCGDRELVASALRLRNNDCCFDAQAGRLCYLFAGCHQTGMCQSLAHSCSTTKPTSYESSTYCFNSIVHFYFWICRRR